jgi:prepilin-type processing-associated H-X9-DG protein
VSREGKSILDNEGFVALRKRLGGERAVSFQFYDLPRSAPTSYQVWLLASSFAKVGDVLGVDTPPALLPPLGTLIEHLTVAGAVSWVDDRGWHLRAVTPFPGSTMLASETAGLLDVQSSALGMSILLPSLSRAREQANRVKSASNLRQIGLGAMIYANDNKGRFPDDLGTLHASGDLTLEVFVNPRTNTTLPPGLKGDAAKRWLNEEADYVYVGKGKKHTAGPDEVLAYERPGTVDEGINILFADGHVEFMLLPQATQVIEKGKQ